MSRLLDMRYVTEEMFTPYKLEREPTRWMCSTCFHVNRALRPVCNECQHRRWEHLGFSKDTTLLLGHLIYDIHRQRERGNGNL